MIDMAQIGEWLKLFLDLSFPVAVSAYLLFFVFKELRTMVFAITTLILEVRVGLSVILAELDAQEKFDRQLQLEKAKTQLAKEKK